MLQTSYIRRGNKKGKVKKKSTFVRKNVSRDMEYQLPGTNGSNLFTAAKRSKKWRRFSTLCQWFPK
jgi:hypothetical protein